MGEQCNKMQDFQQKENNSCECNCGCGHKKCDCGCQDAFFKIADEAWVEVLKDKIKNYILAHKNDHIESLAEIIAKANGDKWHTIMSAKNKNQDYKDKLKDFFSKCD